jgi:tRNA A37 threonylcarbamoyladenosine synthetase subunit TsaC/SUA5/YrdC
MPGPVTMVQRVAADVMEERLPDMGLERSLASVLWKDGTIGLRCPDHPSAQAILGANYAP